MSVRKPVIMDCDPGHDDAIALVMAFASDALDVKLVTTLAGNQTPDKTLNNALRVLSFIGAEVEVAQGARKPLVRDLIIAPEVHGESGLEGTYIPEPTLCKSERSAVDAMADVIKKSEDKITLIPTGPLTNIASLLLAHPEAKENIERISLMGGSCIGGNWTPAAEFNILVDPEAASIVFGSKVPITMCGLDVTHKALIYDEEIEKMHKLGGKVSKMVAELLDFFALFHKKQGFKGSPLHDPCAVAYVIDPTIITTKKCHVDIETRGEFTTGATVADLNDVLKLEKNVDVALDIDRERFINLLFNSVKHYK
jgi:pyrimidine-specific ribonucleoside hydrolase